MTTDEYFEALTAKYCEARVIEAREVRFSDGSSPQPRNCHANADRLCSEIPGHKVVRGFLVTHEEEANLFYLVAHSVVQAPDGTLFDPTPLEEPYRSRFLAHAGTDAQYDDLKQQCDRWWPEDITQAAFMLSGGA